MNSKQERRKKKKKKKKKGREKEGNEKGRERKVINIFLLNEAKRKFKESGKQLYSYY